MPLAAGTRLGPYEIVGALGAGGMGEVYRARDSTLDRDVALKVLPESFAADPDRLMRFEREAKTLAALNHPNICAIYGVGEAPGPGPQAPAAAPHAQKAHFLVMELVEGPTLEEILRGPGREAPGVDKSSSSEGPGSRARGRLDLDDALGIARQIADALEAAHEAGIIHRDLKPANIKVRADGTVKLLDFGLAKALQPPGTEGSGPGAQGLSNSPTMTSPAMTAMGLILGTAGYMSPEQAKGKPVDKRADIWAFGVVLYEMLTGARLFGGETVAETLASVIKDEPHLDRLPANTPSAVRRLLARCLERDPRQRLRDIGEARIALAAGADAVVAPAARVDRRALWVVTAAGILLAAGVGAAAWWMKPVPVVPVRRLELSGDMAAAASLALSPDGTRIAYIAGGTLRVRSLDSLETRDLGTVPVSADDVFWSPDGATIGFYAEGAIRTMPAAGGVVFTVCQVPASGRILDAAWRPDGTIVFSVWRDSLYQVPAAGGEPTTLVAIDPAKDVDFHAVSVLPDNRLLLSTHGHEDGADTGRIEIVDGGRRTVVSAGGDTPLAFEGIRYVAPGYLLFLRDTTNVGLWAVPYSGGSIDLGNAVLVQAGASRFSAAADGTVVALVPPATGEGLALTWVDRAGTSAPIAGTPFEPGRERNSFALSPDGRRVAAAVGAAGEPAQIVVRDLQTGVDTRLTFDDTDKSSPSWFPSGDRVVYAVEHAVQNVQLVARSADGGGDAVTLTKGVTAGVTPDGRELIYAVDDRGHQSLRRAPIGADGTLGVSAAVFHGQDPDVSSFEVSPDGRLLAYAAFEPNQQLDVYVTEYPGATGRWQVASGGSEPQFSHDGRELFYLQGTRAGAGALQGQLMGVPVSSRPTVTLGVPKALFDVPGLATYAVAPDGQRFLMARPSGAGAAAGPHLVLIQDWPKAIGASR